ncbi:MAG: hypothetical protein R3E68_02405, partial [Burkholderiaceae bacterium]
VLGLCNSACLWPGVVKGMTVPRAIATITPILLAGCAADAAPRQAAHKADEANNADKAGWPGATSPSPGTGTRRASRAAERTGETQTP